MPTRSYGNVDLSDIVIQNDYQLNGSISGDGFTLTASAIVDVSGGTDTCEILRTTDGSLDFTAFPSIPASAVITKVEVGMDYTGITTGPTNLGNGYFVTVVLIRDPDGAGVILGTETETEPPSISPTSFLNSPIAFDSGVLALTRAQLIAQFGRIRYGIFSIASYVGLGTSDNLTIDITTSNFTLTVTYDLENYSWYIKPTTQIVNGRPVRIVASPDDIAAIPDGDDIPDGYIFYGTGEDYPDGPEYVWWYSEEWYLYYIFSPITPQEDLMWGVWIRFDGVPTCTGCTSVALGELTVLVANASGVYQLDPNAKHDEVYVRTGFSIFVEAEDVKIPTPGGKTGFVP